MGKSHLLKKSGILKLFGLIATEWNEQSIAQPMPNMLGHIHLANMYGKPTTCQVLLYALRLFLWRENTENPVHVKFTLSRWETNQHEKEVNCITESD